MRRDTASCPISIYRPRHAVVQSRRPSAVGNSKVLLNLLLANRVDGIHMGDLEYYNRPLSIYGMPKPVIDRVAGVTVLLTEADGGLSL